MPPAPPPRLRDVGSRTPRRVLVIDDEVRMQQSLRLLLESAGYEVETAGGGVEGLAKFEAGDFPVVITDLRMAQGDGFGVMKALAERPDAAFIVITGHATTETAIEALQRRAFDFLTKPFDFDQLRSAVERAFARIDADRFRDDMVSMITHDVKIPLSSILGYSALIFDPATGAPHARAREFMTTVRSNAQKMLALLDNFLTTCKIDSGRLTLYLREVNLHHVVEDVAGLFRPEAQRQGIDLSLDLAADPPTFLADEPLVQRAVTNMVSNACKYTPQGGAARVATARLATADSPLGVESMAVVVSNTGPGIAPEDLPTILDKYRRSRPERGIEGSGIGTHVMRYVVEAHGGSLNVESVPNELTTFTAHFPVGRVQVGVPRPGRAAAAWAGRASRNKGGGFLMVASKAWFSAVVVAAGMAGAAGKSPAAWRRRRREVSDSPARPRPSAADPRLRPKGQRRPHR